MKENTLESLIKEANGNLDAACDAFAESKVPKAMPFMVTIGEKTPEMDPHADKRQQWKKFVHAYKEDYLAHLKSGFDLTLSMLNEIANEHDVDPSKRV